MFWCCGLVGRESTLGENFSLWNWSAEYQSPRCSMAGGGAVVNERAPLFRFEELSDIGRADFQFERGGHAVERFHPLALHLLTVLMQVNESGRNDQVSGMDDPASGELAGRNTDNLAVEDANVAHGIEAGFGIHDTSAFEHEVELLRGHDGD